MFGKCNCTRLWLRERRRRKRRPQGEGGDELATLQLVQLPLSVPALACSGTSTITEVAAERREKRGKERGEQARVRQARMVTISRTVARRA